MDEKRAIKEKAVEFQNDLESMPELAWQEYNTKQYIVDRLGKDYVWSEKTALIYKIGAGPAIFLRSELDALNTKVGPKHVCGHSSHMAALMAVYLHLKANPPKGKSVYFIFQPSEEGYPSGASFIEENFLKKHKIDTGFAIHTFPSKKPGELIDVHWASADYFEITIEGTGTHIKNKYADTTCDTVLPVSYLAQLINSSHYPRAIMNTGVMSAGETPNSIAGQGVLKGDIRALDEVDRKSARNDLEVFLTKTKKKYPAFSYKKYLNPAYPMLKNPSAVIEKLRSLFEISQNKLESFATEDFSLYKGKTVFLLVGTGCKTELHELLFRVPPSVTKQIVEYWLRIISVFP